MNHDLHESDHSGIVKFDARDPAAAADNGQGNALKQGKVYVNVEGLCLESGESISDGQESMAHIRQVVQALIEEEVLEVIGT